MVPKTSASEGRSRVRRHPPSSLTTASVLVRVSIDDLQRGRIVL
jgi:hypothetical protein